MHTEGKPGRWKFWLKQKVSLQKLASVVKKLTGEIICNVPSVRITNDKMENGMESKSLVESLWHKTMKIF